jgi:hypothetical protein
MKLLLVLVLTVSMAAAAAAQAVTAPAQPPADNQAAPAQPAADKPAMPSEDKPAMPSGEKPALPSDDKPALPSGDKPAMPSEDEPDQSGKITDWRDTTPEIIRSPEVPFFRPFHVEGSTQTLIETGVDREMTFDEKTGEKRLYTVSELKRKQALELKALRRSLIKRPNSEIRKAVKVRETEQKAQLKTLQNRIRAEAEKNQKAPAGQKPVIVKPPEAQ